MTRWTQLVLRHRLVVALLWLAVAVAGALTARSTVDALSYDFSLPGQPAYETNQSIVDRFGGGGLTDPLVVVTGEGAEVAAAVGELDALGERLARDVEGTRVVTPSSPGGDVLVADDVAAIVVYPAVTPGPDPYAVAMPAIERTLHDAEAGGEPVQLTGFELLSEGSAGGDRGVLVEVVLGGLGALVVLALVFGSLLAGVPLLIAAASILATFLSLLGLTKLTDVSFVAQYLVALIGLGVAIDYSLLVVMRWREERAGGADNDEAIAASLATAGRSVLFSGVTVAVSLAALVVTPLPFLRSIGLSGLLIPLLSVLATLTLLPVLLSVAGDRLQWPRRRFTSPSSRAWRRLTTWVVRRRWLVIGATTLLLLAMAAPLTQLTLGAPQLGTFSARTPAAQAAQRLVADGLPGGVLRPTEVLVPVETADAAAELAAVDGVAGVAAPDAWATDGVRLLQVYPTDDASSAAGRATLDRVLALDVGDVGGTPAEDADFIEAVYGSAGWVVLGVALVTFLLLARALRSLWLPVKALILNVVSLAAAYGMAVFIWQDGHGTQLLFDTAPSGSITIWVPIAAFAFLFGLSMDYEVFILSRMREAYDEHGDTDLAVVEGIESTGRLVTSAALILFLAFVALSTVPSVDVKILATTLALGIILDAVVVRGLLAPAIVSVLGGANWTLPRPLARLLRL